MHCALRFIHLYVYRSECPSIKSSHRAQNSKKLKHLVNLRFRQRFLVVRVCNFEVTGLEYLKKFKHRMCYNN